MVLFEISNNRGFGMLMSSNSPGELIQLEMMGQTTIVCEPEFFVSPVRSAQSSVLVENLSCAGQEFSRLTPVFDRPM